MNYTNLYKYKTIHAVYLGGDSMLHVEGFPIVYINKDYVYWAMSGSSLLEHTYMKCVHDGFDEAGKSEILDMLACGRMSVPVCFVDIDVEEVKNYCKELNGNASFYTLRHQKERLLQRKKSLKTYADQITVIDIELERIEKLMKEL